MFRSIVLMALIAVGSACTTSRTESRQERVTTRSHSDGVTVSTTTTVSGSGSAVAGRTTTTDVQATQAALVAANHGSARARGPLIVRLDDDDCEDGFMTMDLDVSIGDSRAHLSPSCGFTFSRSFALRGWDCRARSGMCSHFMGRGRMIVECTWPEDGMRIRREEVFGCRD